MRMALHSCCCRWLRSARMRKPPGSIASRSSNTASTGPKRPSGPRRRALPPDTSGRLTDIRNSEVSRTVPARPRVRFGFRYHVAGAPDGAQVPITIVDKFLKQGLRKPGSAETFYREEYVATKTIGQESYSDYGFDHDWELVPGT
jgi:hypothetical protein